MLLGFYPGHFRRRTSPFGSLSFRSPRECQFSLESSSGPSRERNTKPRESGWAETPAALAGPGRGKSPPSDHLLWGKAPGFTAGRVTRPKRGVLQHSKALPRGAAGGSSLGSPSSHGDPKPTAQPTHTSGCWHPHTPRPNAGSDAACGTRPLLPAPQKSTRDAGPPAQAEPPQHTLRMEEFGQMQLQAAATAAPGCWGWTSPSPPRLPAPGQPTTPKCGDLSATAGGVSAFR